MVKRDAENGDGGTPKAICTVSSVVDVSAFLKDPHSSESKATCDALAASLKETGIVILRDARVSNDEQTAFLNMME